MTHTTLILADNSSDAGTQLQALQAVISHSKLLTLNSEKPVLANWAQQIRTEILNALGHVWLIANGFACLAASVAIADNSDKVAGIVLIDPANPEHFNILGKCCPQDDLRSKSITGLLPDYLDTFGVLIHHPAAILPLAEAQWWAENWGLAFYQAGNGQVPQWRFLHCVLSGMQAGSLPFPQGDLIRDKPEKNGKGSVLATVRRYTRQQLYSD